MGEQLKTCCLPHFTPAMTGKVRGAKLSSYAIALEAWRRGLKVVMHDRRMFRYTIYSSGWRHGIKLNLSWGGKFFPSVSISPQKKVYTFRRSEIVDRHAKPRFKICNNKDITKRLLREKNIPVPDGKRFGSADSDEEIIKYSLNNIGFPVVLKPATGSLGKGVFVNIRDEVALKKYLVHVREELGYSNIIVEEYVEGEDLRVFVAGNKVLGVVKRVPANIVGDGKQTIKELIEKKNLLRKTNPFLANRQIKIDREIIDHLNASGHSIDSVLGKNEVLFLRSKGSGGDPIDITDDIPESIKDLAVRAVKAIPHLYSCGVDIMFDRTKGSQGKGVVIELNCRAHIGLHLFPLKGEARDVSGGIIDYCFPESSARRGQNSRLYFDPELVLRPFISGFAKDIVLAPPPSGRIRYRRLELRGKMASKLKRTLRRKALSLNISGHIKDLKNGNLRVVLAGKKRDIDAFKSYLSKEIPGGLVNERRWSRAVAAGFRIY